MSSIYEKIYERVSSLLSQQRIRELRHLLRSAMNQQDLASFCTDRSRLSLVGYEGNSVARGPLRVFRSDVFCVRLLVLVETNVSDSGVRQVQVTAEIQDGKRSASRTLLKMDNSVQDAAVDCRRADRSRMSTGVSQ